MTDIIKKFWWTLLIPVVYFVFASINFLPAWLNFIPKKTITITETPINIEQIKKIDYLITAEYYGEIYADIYEVYDSIIHKIGDDYKHFNDSITNKYTHLKNYLSKKDSKPKLIYIGRGTVQAKVDFTKITKEEIGRAHV